ncbi:hypothetical protein Ccrd_001188 [Cynara cardunculus var. scolymus]|uniref:Uncharacterized protein n=1 Tax=Cynara cardunculus var. scolymus TaxID=59895 RepID=A0A103XTT3_CYNCS|nr:hypothetical protein Ccrd_001188 [Cynara cardunculus var. scolymus]
MASARRWRMTVVQDGAGSNRRHTSRQHLSDGDSCLAGDRQPLYIAKTKNLITITEIGIIPEVIVLTWKNRATKIDHHQTSRLIGTGSFGCGTAIVEGEDFISENITYEAGVRRSGSKQWKQA